MPRNAGASCAPLEMLGVKSSSMRCFPKSPILFPSTNKKPNYVTKKAGQNQSNRSGLARECRQSELHGGLKAAGFSSLSRRLFFVCCLRSPIGTSAFEDDVGNKLSGPGPESQILTRVHDKNSEEEGKLAVVVGALRSGKSRVGPLPPICWADGDAHLGCSVNPSAADAAAGKVEDVQLAAVEYSQFKVPVERRGVYGLPLDLF
jgi:hypothetical protein